MILIDWISGSFPVEHLEKVKGYFQSLFGYEPIEKPYGRYRYDAQHNFEAHSCTIFFDKSEAKSTHVHNERALVVFTGAGLAMLEPVQIKDMVHFLVWDCWMKATRLDCAFDDYSKRITPTDVWESCCFSSHKYTRFKRCGHHHEIDTSGVSVSDTVYFGVRGENGSGSYLRYYRKDLESDGKIDAFRWEVEFTGQKAQEAFFALSKVEDLKQFVCLVGAYVAGSVDFVERKDKNLNRSTRVEWWQCIVDLLVAVSMRSSQKDSTVEQKRQWVEKSVGTTLSSLEKAFGGEIFWAWLNQLVSAKRPFISSRMLYSISHYEENCFAVCSDFFERAQ